MTLKLFHRYSSQNTKEKIGLDEYMYLKIKNINQVSGIEPSLFCHLQPNIAWQRTGHIMLKKVDGKKVVQ